MRKTTNFTLLVCTILTLIIGTSCNNRNRSEKMDARKIVYACPMHPEVTGEKGEKCPKCGMELQPKKETQKESFRMLFSSPQIIDAGKATNLSFTPSGNDNSSAKVELEVQHEKKFHLIVVSEDLAWFHHIHPEYQNNGSYFVTETFPRGGTYLLFADYKPVGGAKQVEKIPVTVSGKSGQATKFGESDLSATVGGYALSITNGNDLKTGTEQLAISIEKDGRKLKESDLQKYLGANAHIVLINMKDKDFIHIHPSSDASSPIFGETTFSKAGLYRMWVQFQIKGKLHTADFVLNVQQNRKQAESETKDSHSEHNH